MKDRRGLVLKVAASLVVLAVAAIAGWFHFGGGRAADVASPEESVEARRERRDDRREEQAARLRQALEARSRNGKAGPAEAEPAAPPAAEDRSPARLTGAEKAALGAAMAGFYSPGELREALANRTAPDLVREMNRRYGEAVGAESLGGPAGPVPVTPAVREAILRMGLLKDYGQNLLHAQRPEGQEAVQAEMIGKVNGAFRERIDELNGDYPFLGARMVEP